MQHIVTVTCPRDRAQMLAQAQSLALLTQPVTHWVIVDDHELDSWRTLLQPYYSQHRLELLLADATVNHQWNITGWARQQLYKLNMTSVIGESYLTLDSKNYFIRPCSLLSWAGILGCGFWENYAAKAHSWGDTIEQYSAYTGLARSWQHLAMQTPFVIECGVVESADFNWFIRSSCKPSEFLFYSMLAQSKGITGRLATQHYTVYRSEPMPPAAWSDPNCLVAGIHYKVFSSR